MSWLNSSLKCYMCRHLKVVSVPDWFKCSLDNNEAPTQTELNKNCKLKNELAK